MTLEAPDGGVPFVDTAQMVEVDRARIITSNSFR